MVRFLPFILIPLLLVGGLWYWRSSAGNKSYTSQEEQAEAPAETPIEVPKTLPGTSLEDRVSSLESLVAKLAAQVNNLQSSGSQAQSGGSSDSKLANIESSVTDLKVRVSNLEKASPAPASNKSTVYIPLGAGGSWTDIGWNSLAEYEVSLNPDNYPGYTGMSLEANFRMPETDTAGTGSVRLFNVTDNAAVSDQLDTRSASFALKTTASFKLASGTKTYRLQVKSNERREVFIQSARIKVSF